MPQSVDLNDYGIAAPGAVGRQHRPSAHVLPGCPFPLPDCVIEASAGGLASEHIIGIYLSHECLAGLALHSDVSLRSYVSLIGDIERREPCHTVLDRQVRRYREIWAIRSGGAQVLSETADIGSIEVGRRLGLDFRRSRSRRRRLLRRASSNGENRYGEQE